MLLVNLHSKSGMMLNSSSKKFSFRKNEVLQYEYLSIHVNLRKSSVMAREIRLKVIYNNIGEPLIMEGSPKPVQNTSVSRIH